MLPWAHPGYDHRRGGSVRRLVVAAILLCLGLAPTHAAPADETSVKAAVLYNLMPFITWPADALRPGEDLRLCLHDEGALLTAVKTYQGKPIRGNPLVVQRVSDSPDAMRACHAVMVEGGHPARLARAAALASQQPLLVLGEGAGAATRGAMVGITTDSGRVVFEIDLGALRRARLTASSRLLSLAKSLIE